MESFLTHSGYAALVVLAFAEACCIPFPSEITFGFAGFLAYQGKLNLGLVIVIGTLAELAGSYVAYTIGRIGGRPLVNRMGRYVLITHADLDRAERWLSGRGEFAVMVGRALPVLRAFTSLFAGIADMAVIRFGIFSLIGTAAYAVAVSSIGYGLGGAWHQVAHDFSIAGYAIVALIVAGVAAFIWHRLHALRHDRDKTPTA